MKKQFEYKDNIFTITVHSEDPFVERTLENEHTICYPVGLMGVGFRQSRTTTEDSLEETIQELYSFAQKVIDSKSDSSPIKRKLTELGFS